MKIRLLCLVGIFLVFVGAGGAFAVPSTVSTCVAAINPDKHSRVLLKKAHQAISTSLTARPRTIVAPSLWVQFFLQLLGFFAAFGAGILVMLTPYGAMALVFSLGALYSHRHRPFDLLVRNGLIFIFSFVSVYTLTHMFLPYIDLLLETTSFYLLFSLLFIVCVALAAFSLLGILQLKAPQFQRNDEQHALRDFVVMSLLGGASALMLLTQKTSAVAMAARQVSSMSGPIDVLLLSFAAALGIASVIFASWVAASWFMRNEYMDLWVIDSMSFVAWFALYKSVLVLRPLMFSWNYTLLLTLLTCCIAVYYWMSVRMEITYQYIDMYSRAERVDTLLHIFSGWRFFSTRILLKRCVAIGAFLAMCSFALKTYLFFYGITVRDVVLQAIKSL